MSVMMASPDSSSAVSITAASLFRRALRECEDERRLLRREWEERLPDVDRDGSETFSDDAFSEHGEDLRTTSSG